uniref:Uncharacterized protein n=1 Tax=Parascaris equorum TaxID=6256 RepID=A0A914RWN8_PAREQ
MDKNEWLATHMLIEPTPTFADFFFLIEPEFPFVIGRRRS